MTVIPLTSNHEVNVYLNAAIRLAAHVDAEIEYNDAVPVTASLVGRVEEFRSARTAMNETRHD